MQQCKTVTLRSRARRNGTHSLFLEFYPGYRDPKTMELIRRRSLGIYIYSEPKTPREKEYNALMIEKAEAISQETADILAWEIETVNNN